MEFSGKKLSGLNTFESRLKLSFERCIDITPSTSSTPLGMVYLPVKINIGYNMTIQFDDLSRILPICMSLVTDRVRNANAGNIRNVSLINMSKYQRFEIFSWVTSTPS